MIVSLIVAVAQNGVIGKNNQLIWHLPRDMKFFKEITSGHCIITGRKNYESIPKKYRPLVNRTNIVVTRQPDYNNSGIIVSHSLEEAIDTAKKRGEKECFIIGGGQIYRQAMEGGLINQMYITHIQEEFDGDTFFPEFNHNDWTQETLLTNLKNDKNPHHFITKKYTKK